MFDHDNEEVESLAHAQMQAARSDPRLGRRRGAAVADFWDAINEAERVRTLAIFGLHELALSEERYGATPDARERALMARSELDNETPLQNAQALISMNSALDAVVEEFVPRMREMRAKMIADHLWRHAETAEPAAAAALTSEQRTMLEEMLRSYLFEEHLPKPKRLYGSGAERYERVLATVGLGAPADRRLPADLDQALGEIGALRDVLTHRAGRVDAKALQQAPTLRYAEGEFVRVSAAEYRTYSAAIRCYSAEIWFRSIRSWPETNDDEHGPRLDRWREYYVIGA